MYTPLSWSFNCAWFCPALEGFKKNGRSLTFGQIHCSLLRFLELIDLEQSSWLLIMSLCYMFALDNIPLSLTTERYGYFHLPNVWSGKFFALFNFRCRGPVTKTKCREMRQLSGVEMFLFLVFIIKQH